MYLEYILKENLFTEVHATGGSTDKFSVILKQITIQ